MKVWWQTEWGSLREYRRAEAEAARGGRPETRRGTLAEEAREAEKEREEEGLVCGDRGRVINHLST